METKEVLNLILLSAGMRRMKIGIFLLLSSIILIMNFIPEEVEFCSPTQFQIISVSVFIVSITLTGYVTVKEGKSLKKVCGIMRSLIKNRHIPTLEEAKYEVNLSILAYRLGIQLELSRSVPTIKDELMIEISNFISWNGSPSSLGKLVAEEIDSLSFCEAERYLKEIG